MLKRRAPYSHANALQQQASRHRSELLENRISEELALQAFEAGTASQDDTQRLIYTVSMAKLLAQAGYGRQEVLPLIDRLTDPPDVALLREIAELHAVQCEVAPVSAYLRARACLR